METATAAAFPFFARPAQKNTHAGKKCAVEMQFSREMFAERFTCMTKGEEEKKTEFRNMQIPHFRAEGRKWFLRRAG